MRKELTAFCLVVLCPAARATFLGEQVARSTVCHQAVLPSETEIEAWAQTLSEQKGALSRQLIAGDPEPNSKCQQTDTAERARCKLGSSYNILLLLLGKYGVNASPLQAIPAPLAPPTKPISPNSIRSLSFDQLRIVLAASMDAYPYLLPQKRTLRVFYGDMTQTTSFVDEYEEPMVSIPVKNPADVPGVRTIRDKALLVHEFCHFFAYEQGQMDVSEGWLKASNWTAPREFRSAREAVKEHAHFRSSDYPRLATEEAVSLIRRSGKKELERRVTEIDVSSRPAFVSGYARDSVAEDFAESCLSYRYDAREWKTNSPRLASKLEFIKNHVFRGRQFVPKKEGCETGGSTGPDAGKTSTTR